MCERNGSKGRRDSHHQTVRNKGGDELIERSFILKDEMGLHARPAAMLMVRMLHVSSSVEIICGDRWICGCGPAGRLVRETNNSDLNPGTGLNRVFIKM